MDLLRRPLDPDGRCCGPLEVRGRDELPGPVRAAARDARLRLRSNLLQRQGAESSGSELEPALRAAS